MSLKLATDQAAAEQTTETSGSDVFQELLQKVTRIEARQAEPRVQPMELRTFDELERWAERAARTEMVPKGYKGKPDDIILAVQMGAELGLRPMQSLQNIATVNGRPSIWGDAMLALCMMHPLYLGIEEIITGEGDAREATCVANRKGDLPKKKSFSVADAKRAGLFRNEIWLKYTDRMLQMRARGFALRDAFPDKLRGLISAEEATDYNPHSAAPSLEAEILAQHASKPASSTSSSSVQHDPKMVRWLEDTMKVLDEAKTLKGVNKIVEQIEANLEELRTSAPDLAQTLAECIAANRERTQKLAPEQNRADHAAEPKPAAPAMPSGFEHFGIDEFGEPVSDAAGEFLLLTTPMQVANFFSTYAAKTGNILAFRENNADAIADAGADKNAALIIQAAIDGATQRANKKAAAESSSSTTTTTTAPTPSAALPLTQTPGGKPHWPNYLEAAKKQISATTFPDTWRTLNAPTYRGSPIEAGIEKALRERDAALTATKPADELGAWGEKWLAWVQDPAQTYESILKWAMQADAQNTMAHFKSTENAYYAKIRDAIDARKAA